MDEQRYMTAIGELEKLDRQHPRSDMTEKSKLMQVYANYRIGKFEEAILAADRFLALYPTGKDVPYVLYLKGTSYFGQIKDITRDQQLSQRCDRHLQSADHQLSELRLCRGRQGKAGRRL